MRGSAANGTSAAKGPVAGACVQARQLTDKAEQAVRRQDVDAGHGLLEEARRRCPQAGILPFIARVYLLANDRPRAAAVLAEFRDAPSDPSLPEENGKLALATLRRLEQELARLTVSGAALVQVDGDPARATTREIYLAPGPHRLRFPSGVVNVILRLGANHVAAPPPVEENRAQEEVIKKNRAPDQRPRLRALGWSCLGSGLAALTAGGVLFGLDGRECDRAPGQVACPNLPLDTRGAGVTVSVVGGALTIAGITLIAVGYRGQGR